MFDLWPRIPAHAGLFALHVFETLIPASQVAALDTAPEWTLDQIAGLAFGVGAHQKLPAPPAVIPASGILSDFAMQGLMVACFLLATKVDEYVARSQRRELGLCEACGGLNEVSSCKVPNCPMRAHLQNFNQ